MANFIPSRPPSSAADEERRAWYQSYLETSHWKAVRKHALYLAQHRCQSPTCADAWMRSYTHEELREMDAPAQRLEVHHLTYERLGAELPDDLMVLCDQCHAAVHGIDAAERRPGWHALSELLEMLIAKMAGRVAESDQKEHQP